MQGSSHGSLRFLALPPFPLMSPAWTPQGLRKEGEEGFGGLQVCLESQTVLHFPCIPLQLTPVNERGSGHRDPGAGPRTDPHTHTHTPNVPNVLASTRVLGVSDSYSVKNKL